MTNKQNPNQECCEKCIRPSGELNPVDDIFIYDEECSNCPCHSPVKREENTQDSWEKKIDYNSHDMGELGKFIRVEYAKNIIKSEKLSGKKEAIEMVREKIERVRENLRFMNRTEDKAVFQTEGYNQALSDLLSLIYNE